MVLFSCKKSEINKLNVEKNLSENKIEVKQILYTNPDTLIKKSNAFIINKIKCYWLLTLIVYQDLTGGTGIMELKNYKTNKRLLSYDDYYNKDFYTNFETYTIDDDHLKDANFDGFKDFIVLIREASGSAGDYYNVYLFDNKSKTFTLSKEISNYGFEIDTINKTTSNYYKSGYSFNISSISYFNKKGKIKFTETIERKIIQKNDTEVLKTTFTKSIGEKIIKKTIDTTDFNGY